MNFQKVFDLAYSNISEEVKRETLKAYSLNISEEVIEEKDDIVENMVDYIDLMATSKISEGELSSFIDEYFSDLSEEVIEDIYNRFIKRKVYEAFEKYTEISEVSMAYVQRKAQNAISQRKEEADLGKPNFVQRMMGKTSTALGRERARTGATARSQARLEHAKKVAGNIGKLRSAAEKVAGERRREEAHHEATYHTTAAKRDPKTAATATINRAKAGLRAEHAEDIASGKARYRSPEAKQAEVKERRKKEAAQAHREEAQKKAGKHIESGAPISMDNVGIKRTKASAEATKKALDKTGSKEAIPMGTAKTEKVEKAKTTKAKKAKVKAEKVETPKATKTKKTSKKAETPKEVKAKKAKVDKVKAEKVETPKVPKTKKDTATPTTVAAKKGASKKSMTPEEKEEALELARQKREDAAKLQNKKKALENARERLKNLTSKPGFDSDAAETLRKQISNLQKETANEALSIFITSLAKSNISESSFVEIMELMVNKDLVHRVEDKKQQEALKIADSINKDVAHNQPVNPNKVEAAEKAAQRYETFKKWADDRYDKNQ